MKIYQKEGTRFLFKCLLGNYGKLNQGGILLDAQGLGKSIQVIALLWTLLT